MQVYDKSPLNYIGGKYKLLPQIMRFFPKQIHTMVDLFAGGLDVACNTKADQMFCNDINRYVVDIYQAFQRISIEELLCYIDQTICRYHLSETDQAAFLTFRTYYNQTKNPLDLYILVCFSFNYQFRFNSRHEYNNPFGKNRSWFNPTMRENLIKFHKNIRDFQFSSVNFKEFPIQDIGPGDFLYADPPYRITTGSYNDGKRGFEGWSSADDLELFSMLDEVDRQGGKFALSNVTEHKGNRNQELISWKKRYHTHRIDIHYNNSSYQAKHKDKVTREVLITNY